MKLKSFLAGVLTTLLVLALALPALAATDFPSSIGIGPINILVNGEVFQPKDANGNDVLVFVSNGTTYAPLRALAAAYGLKVDYDDSRKMAIVTDPDVKQPDEAAVSVSGDYSSWTAEEEAAYQEWKGMWDIKFDMTGENKPEGRWIRYNADWTHGTIDWPAMKQNVDEAYGHGYVTRLFSELIGEYDTIAIVFACFDPELGSTHQYRQGANHFHR